MMIEKRLAEIYSYYLADCYEDDFSGTFAKWMIGNMYGDELSKLVEQCLVDYTADIQPISIEEVEVIEAQYQASRVTRDDDEDMGFCPSCGEALKADDVGSLENTDLYCRLCGQRLDEYDDER
jgi:hypothetical protein